MFITYNIGENNECRRTKLLILNNIVPFESEKVEIDEFTQTVKWDYLGKPTDYYWEAGDTKVTF